MLKVVDINFLQIALFMYKYKNDLLPESCMTYCSVNLHRVYDSGFNSDETVYRLSVYRLSVSVYRYRTDLEPIPNLKSVLYRIHTDFNTDSSSVLESVLYRFKYRFQFGIGIGIIPIQIPIPVRYCHRYLQLTTFNMDTR